MRGLARKQLDGSCAETSASMPGRVGLAVGRDRSQGSCRCNRYLPSSAQWDRRGERYSSGTRVVSTQAVESAGTAVRAGRQRSNRAQRQRSSFVCSPQRVMRPALDPVTSQTTGPAHAVRMQRVCLPVLQPRCCLRMLSNHLGTRAKDRRQRIGPKTPSPVLATHRAAWLRLQRLRALHREEHVQGCTATAAGVHQRMSWRRRHRGSSSSACGRHAGSVGRLAPHACGSSATGSCLPHVRPDPFLQPGCRSWFHRSLVMPTAQTVRGVADRAHFCAMQRWLGLPASSDMGGAHTGLASRKDACPCFAEALITANGRQSRRTRVSTSRQRSAHHGTASNK